MNRLWFKRSMGCIRPQPGMEARIFAGIRSKQQGRRRAVLRWIAAGTCAAGTKNAGAPSALASGEVYIRSDGGTSIWLKNSGDIILSGNITVQGNMNVKGSLMINGTPIV